jgi:hypothetical protein
MTPILLLAALASIIPYDPWNPPVVPECETIQDLNPTGQLYDMVDWSTLDADLRATSHMASEAGGLPGPYGGAYVVGTVVKADRITYLKTLEGDTWDVNLVDDIGIWSWRTETNWNTPRSYTQFRRVGQVLNSPRMARGGYPGMRWINCDSAYAAHRDCAAPTSYGHLGYIIHELYGPYYFDPGYGDVAGLILKLAYYYGCTAPTTDSCSSVEVTWLSKRYGAFAWRLYEKRTDGWALTAAPPMTVYVVPGVIKEVFPCDDLP